MSLDFVNQHVFLIYIETAQNSREECNEFADLLFWGLSLCLSRESLSCDTRSLDLCILFKFIFLYLWYNAPHSCAFHTVYFTPIFSYVYYYTNLGVVVVNSGNCNIPDALWEITLAWAWVRLAEVTVKWSKSTWGGVLNGRLTAADFAKAFKLYQTLF